MRVSYRIHLEIDTNDHIETLKNIDDVLQDGLKDVEITFVSILKPRQLR